MINLASVNKQTLKGPTLSMYDVMVFFVYIGGIQISAGIFSGVVAVVAVIGIVIILLLVVVIIIIKSRRKSTNIKTSCEYCWFTSSIVGSHSSVWEPTSILACQHLNQRMQFVWLGCSDACSIVAEATV